MTDEPGRHFSLSDIKKVTTGAPSQLSVECGNASGAAVAAPAGHVGAGDNSTGAVVSVTAMRCTPDDDLPQASVVSKGHDGQFTQCMRLITNVSYRTITEEPAKQAPG